MKLYYLLFFFLTLAWCPTYGQDTLPNFSIVNMDGKVLIGWHNDYTRMVSIINVQRSKDSTNNYSTIGEVPDPQKKENRFTDKKPPFSNMFYRLFIAFEGGGYAFTKIARPSSYLPPARDSPVTSPSRYVYIGKENNVYISLPEIGKKIYTLKFYDSQHHPIFELNRLKESYLVLEKVNFLHAGFFYFELYEDGKLVEKNKISIAAE